MFLRSVMKRFLRQPRSGNFRTPTPQSMRPQLREIWSYVNNVEGAEGEERGEQGQGRTLHPETGVHSARETPSTFPKTGTHSTPLGARRSKAGERGTQECRPSCEGKTGMQTGLPQAALSRVRTHGWEVRNERDKARVEGGSQTEYAGYQV